MKVQFADFDGQTDKRLVFWSEFTNDIMFTIGKCFC